jgi:hypothetical protein
MKHHGQSKVERKGFIYLIDVNQDRKSSRARTWRQRLTEAMVGRVLFTGLLLIIYSDCLLIESSTTIPGIVTFIIGWALPYQSLRKMPCSSGAQLVGLNPHRGHILDIYNIVLRNSSKNAFTKKQENNFMVGGQCNMKSYLKELQD